MAAFVNVAINETIGLVEVEVFDCNNRAIAVRRFNDENQAVNYALSTGLPNDAINYNWE